jgi:hypothetical protein
MSRLKGGDWEPAAEILSPRFFAGEGSRDAISVSLFQRRTFQDLAFKDREDNASQLNRLGVAYFLIVYFQFQPPYIGFAFFFVLEAESLLNLLRLGISKASAHSCQRVSSFPPKFRRVQKKRCSRSSSDSSRRLKADSWQLYLHRVNFMVKPNGRLVLVSYECYHSSTSSLSTR